MRWEQACHIHPGDRVTFRDDLLSTQVTQVERDYGPPGTDRHDTGKVEITTSDGQTREFGWVDAVCLLGTTNRWVQVSEPSTYSVDQPREDQA